MKIKGRDLSRAERDRLIGEIGMLASPRPPETRICGTHCNEICPACGKRDCTCACTRDCRHIARALSSEPDRFPLEPGIASLVFALKCLGAFDPCWSCEGHNDVSGKLFRLPQVWFYCDSTVQVRLLSDALSDLSGGQRVRADWRVSVTYSDDDNPKTTFALLPFLSDSRETSLIDLQKDVDTIAREIGPRILAASKKLLGQLG